MLEVVVGTAAVLMVLAGIVVMAGPALPRLMGLALRRRTGSLPRRPPIRRRAPGPRPRPAAGLSPTTGKAISAAARLADLLKDNGFERQATGLRQASRRLQEEESAGIPAMRQALKQLHGVRLDDRADQEILQGLIGQLRKHLDDRAEQLELLPPRR